MTYHIHLDKRVSKQIEKFPKEAVTKIIRSLEKLKSGPMQAGSKKLVGREGFRLRVGNYSILHTVDALHKAIVVYSIGDLKDIYRLSH